MMGIQSRVFSFTNRRSHSGFTLIEIMVALAIGGLLLTGAWGLVAAIADTADSSRERSAVADHEAHAAGMIRGLIRRAELDPTRDLSFSGTSDSARFSSWCDSPRGWQERCSVRLVAVRHGDDSVVRTRTSTGLDLGVAGLPATGGLIYLDQRAEPREWRPYWNIPGAAPSAIGAVRDRDTLLLVIGQ